MLIRFDRLKHLHTMPIRRFKPGFIRAKTVEQFTTSVTMQLNRFELFVFMRNRFNRLKHVYTMHINLFKPVLFMLNLFDMLKHQ